MSAPFHFEGIDPSLLASPAAEPWAWWQAAFSGRPQPFSDKAPQTGFWRYRQRAADRGHACAIWHQDDEGWICLIDGKPFRDIAHAWTFCHQRPITESTYQVVCEGGAWPDEVAAAPTIADGPPPAGHNAALPEELALDAVRQADEAFRAQLATWGGTVVNEEQDAAAAGYKERLAKLRIDGEAARKAAKQVHLDAGRAVDAAWKPVETAALDAEGGISKAVTAYRVAREQARQVAAAAEQAAADKLRAEQAAAAASAVAQGAPPPPAPVITAARTPRRATGLQKVDELVIDDLDATVAWIMAKSPRPTDFVEAVKKVVNRHLVHGAVPGARIESSFKGR